MTFITGPLVWPLGHSKGRAFLRESAFSLRESTNFYGTSLLSKSFIFTMQSEKSDSGTDDITSEKKKKLWLLAAIQFTFCFSENVTDNKAFDELQYVVKLKAF